MLQYAYMQDGLQELCLDMFADMYVEHLVLSERYRDVFRQETTACQATLYEQSYSFQETSAEGTRSMCSRR